MHFHADTPSFIYLFIELIFSCPGGVDTLLTKRMPPSPHLPPFVLFFCFVFFVSDDERSRVKHTARGRQDQQLAWRKQFGRNRAGEAAAAAPLRSSWARAGGAASHRELQVIQINRQRQLIVLFADFIDFVLLRSPVGLLEGAKETNNCFCKNDNEDTDDKLTITHHDGFLNIDIRANAIRLLLLWLFPIIVVGPVLDGVFMQLSILKASLPCDTLHQRRSYFCPRGLHWTDEGECACVRVCGCIDSLLCPTSQYLFDIWQNRAENTTQKRKKKNQKKWKNITNGSISAARSPGSVH